MSELINIQLEKEKSEEFPWYQELPHTRKLADRVARSIRRATEELGVDPISPENDGEDMLVIGTGVYLPEVPALIHGSGAKNLTITAVDGGGDFRPWRDYSSYTTGEWSTTIPEGKVHVVAKMAEQELPERLEHGNLPDRIFMTQIPDLMHFKGIFELTGVCAVSKPHCFVFSGGIGFGTQEGLKEEIEADYPPGYEVIIKPVRSGSNVFVGGTHYCGIVQPETKRPAEITTIELVDL